MRDHRNQPAAEIIAALHDRIRGFAENQTLLDDVTIVIVKVESVLAGVA